MAYGDNKIEFEAGAPKKADVLIRSTQHIALKQEELSEQTRLALARIDEAIELFSKNNQDASYVVKQSGEIFSQLQGENSALKQELLYLAKQSENIYAGLAEKITELSEQAKTREDVINGLADRINDVAEQTRRGEDVYSNIVDKLTQLAEQNQRSEKLYAELNEKLDAITEHNKKNEKAYGELSEKMTSVSEKQEPVEVDNTEILKKINFISEQLRRSDGAHSMLADRFEILSMRVEQFGFESAKAPAYQHAPVQPVVQPVAYPAPVQTVPVQTVPVQTVVKEQVDIDYDKLAEKVAALISAREVVSPDYIASKVAEQIIIPEAEPANVNVSVDSEKIARQVADYIGNNAPRYQAAAPVVAGVNIDEEGLAERLAQKLGGLRVEETAVASAAPVIDEESLAERIASKVGAVKTEVSAPVFAGANIDEEELADAISLKVGSLKAEDFEILVDDDGCTSISRGITDTLDYEKISNIIADKLREALDLAAVNAPDYEEMAERISEKITVAGINEDAIADKAAAVLSNYLPEFDTDEITDKITGAVIDVVSAIPQPTVDGEAICNTISERLIESQEDHDYDIVIDDDGIMRITELVGEEIGKETGERFDKVEKDIAKLTEMLAKREESAEAEEVAETEQAEEVAAAEEDYSALTAALASEIEKGTSRRFDKVEEDIAKLTELVSGAVSDVDYEEDYEETEEDYTALSEVVAAEIEKGVSSRLDSVEENIVKLTELISGGEEVEEYDETEEVYDEAEEDCPALSVDAVKEVTARLDGIEENIVKLTELISGGEETEEYDETEEEYDEVEEDYTALSEVVAAEVEKVIAARLDAVDENIGRLTELMTVEEVEEETETEDVEADYTAITEAVAAETAKEVGARLDGIEENIAKITELITANAQESERAEEVEDYAALSETVKNSVSEEVSARLDGIEENIAKITELITANAQESEKTEEVEEDYTALSAAVAAETAREVGARLDGVEDSIAKVTALIAGGVAVQSQSGEATIDYELLSEAVTAGIAKEVSARLAEVEQSISGIADIVAGGVATEIVTEKVEEDYSAISEVLAAEIERGVAPRFDGVERNIAEITEFVKNSEAARVADDSEDEVALADRIIGEIAARLDGVEQSVAKISETVANAVTEQNADGRAAVEGEASSDAVAQRILNELSERLDGVERGIADINRTVANEVAQTRAADAAVNAATTDGLADRILREVSARLDGVEDNIAKITAVVDAQNANANNELLDKIRQEIAELGKRPVADGADSAQDGRFEKMQEEIAQIKEMITDGVMAANLAAAEAAAAAANAAAQAAEAVAEQTADDGEEEELVTVSDLVKPEEQEEESADEEEGEEDEGSDDGEEDDDFLIDVLDMDRFGDNELMPGEMSDFAGGVDFANMMKFKRSFIARIIQSNDDYKQYYGEVKHALLSYKKVNSNVAWGAERFNKGRETIARMKIRGKTLCLYLALDPNEYKTSVYHHLDVSDNKSVAGTPMMVKIKSNLGVRKAIRLIDEMLAMRNGEKKEIPERDYAAMYPYETIEELIEDGLVKDVRKK